MTGSLRQQRTLARPACVNGVGYWSGSAVSVEFRPAPAGSGLVFVRADLDPPRRIPATVESRFEVPRRTCLRNEDAQVEMVEHVLAALSGMRIDNCEIWVDQAEMPGCDGSSLPFVASLEEAGVAPQPAERSRIRVPRVVRVGSPDVWAEARPPLGDAFTVECHIDYGPRGPIGRQSLLLTVTPETFREHLAAARTFLLEPEAEWIRAQGLGAHVTWNDLVVFGPDGPIGNRLRYPDECVRHKALDMVGDLALAGCDLSGHFIAHCSGHRLNAQLVSAVREAARTSGDRRRAA